MKKLMTLAVVVALVLLAFAPLVLAQQEQASPSDAPTPAPGFTVGCQVLYNDPAANCAVDENGFIALPDGSTAPVVIEPDGTAYTVGEDGTLTVIGQGAALFPEDETAPGDDTGTPQYDPAQGAPPAPSTSPIQLG